MDDREMTEEMEPKRLPEPEDFSLLLDLGWPTCGPRRWPRGMLPWHTKPPAGT